MEVFSNELEVSLLLTPNLAVLLVACTAIDAQPSVVNQDTSYISAIRPRTRLCPEVTGSGDKWQ
eukprot:scaffold3744_cov215-Prasinococcus_capsulatus_cf.AAC.1